MSSSVAFAILASWALFAALKTVAKDFLASTQITAGARSSVPTRASGVDPPVAATMSAANVSGLLYSTQPPRSVSPPNRFITLSFASTE